MVSCMYARTDPELDKKHFAVWAAVASPGLDGPLCGTSSTYVSITNSDTVNEHATIDALVKGVEFYTHMIIAMDQSPIERVV